MAFVSYLFDDIFIHSRKKIIAHVHNAYRMHFIDCYRHLSFSFCPNMLAHLSSPSFATIPLLPSFSINRY